MTRWVNLIDEKPEIPPTRDYITITIQTGYGLNKTIFFSRRWGWRDDKFNKVEDVHKWDKDSIK